jgi:uncharacterized membrane protein YjjP (DUF1212 family)
MRMQTAIDPVLLIMENGGATAMAARALDNMLRGFGAAPCAVVWRLDSITLAVTDAESDSVLVRPVGPVGMNVLRASEAATLAERFAAGVVAEDALATEIQRIKRIPPPNPWWMALYAAIASGAFSQIFSGDYGALGLAAGAGGLGQLARAQLQSWKFPRGITTLLCTLVSALAATAGLRLGLSETVGATLMASVIYAAPGLLLINGYLDATSERFLFIGTQRLLHASFLFLLLTLSVLCADMLL